MKILTGEAGQRPNQVLADPYCTPKQVSWNLNNNCWINLSAFQNPATGTLGNEGVDNLLGPGFVDVDAALSRRFPITERQSVEVRFEAFNLFNHVNFLNPGTAGIGAVGTNNLTMTSSTFGQIQADVGPRVMQFAIKYAF